MPVAALVEAGVLDALSSDYVPATLLAAAWTLARCSLAQPADAARLPQAIAKRSAGPRPAVGLHDRARSRPACAPTWCGCARSRVSRWCWASGAAGVGWPDTKPGRTGAARMPGARALRHHRAMTAAPLPTSARPMSCARTSATRWPSTTALHRPVREASSISSATTARSTTGAPATLVSSTRFIFNHAMAWRHLERRPQWLEAVRHGLRFLDEAHAQPQGGHAWVIEHDPDHSAGGAPGARPRVIDGTNHAYGQAFVLLAHAHALMAGVEGGPRRSGDLLALMETRF